MRRWWVGVAAVAAVVLVHGDEPMAPSTDVVPLALTAFGDSASEVRADFNGDGFSDLVIGLDSGCADRLRIIGRAHRPNPVHS